MDSNWPLARIELRVLDLDEMGAFYRGLGLTEMNRSPARASFGAGDQEVLMLDALPDGLPRPPNTAGLYHLALRLPSRADLVRFARFGLGALRFTDASDHLVSEALYFSDPEGNGIEVYADRPAEGWQWDGRRIRMASIPISVQDLALEAEGPWSGFPSDTKLGHIHLNVCDLDLAQASCHRLGMTATAEIPGARFMSWGRYHHHIGLNVWEGPFMAPPTANTAGLACVVLRRDGGRQERLQAEALFAEPAASL